MPIHHHFVLFSIFIFISFVYLLRNPVYCILSFIGVVAHVVFLLIALETEYLAYVLAIVYIGAIVVLFLFVIMMFYIKQGAPNSGTPSTYLVIQSFLLGTLASLIYFNFNFDDLFVYTDYTETLYSTNDFTFIIAYYLFDKLSFLTIIAACIMLIGIIGSISLTLKPPVLQVLGEIRYRIKIWSALRFKRPFQTNRFDRKQYITRPRLSKFLKWTCTPHPGLPREY